MKPNLSLLAPALLALAGALALAPARADTADASDRRVAIGSGAVVGAAETQPQDVVSVLGSTTVDGEAGHNAVAVLGGATVTGTVDHDVVVVLGNLYVNGTVGHNAVAVLGNIHLGPKALIEGDVVSVNGSVHKDPGARIGGSIVHSGIGSIAGAPDAAYRPVGWLRAPVFRHLWPLQLLGLVLSALVALVFPGAVRTTGDQLRERPGSGRPLRHPGAACAADPDAAPADHARRARLHPVSSRRGHRGGAVRRAVAVRPDRPVARPAGASLCSAKPDAILRRA